MTILDRYIAKQYLFNCVVLLVLLFSMITAIDMALNLHRFVRVATEMTDEQNAGALRRALITFFLVIDLWWPRLLQLFNFMLGLALVAGMGFTFTQMVRHREMSAILASGVSLYRVARPVLVVAVLLSGVRVINQEVVIPRIAPLLARDHDEAGRRDIEAFSVPLTRDSRGRLFYAWRFDPNEEAVERLRVWVRDDTGRARERISADRAVWRDGGWDLEGGYAALMALADGSSGATLARTRVERIETDVSPTELLLRRHASYNRSLSMRQIAQMRASPLLDDQARDRLDRILFGRVSNTISTLLALVIAIPFFLVREPRNMIVQSLKCAPVAIGSLVGAFLGAAAVVPGLPAAVAVFLPVVVMTPIAVAMASSVKT